MGEESRWWRSRAWSSPPPTNTSKNTSTSGMIHTEHLLNAGRRPQTSKRARKPPCDWVGQKKKEIER